jgi:mono/diheme cytochrome c family protein
MAIQRAGSFRAGIASKLLVALFLLALSGGCGSSGATRPIENDAGRDIYMQDCVACHGDPVTGENALPGTPIHGPEGHTWHHPDGQLTGIIDGSVNFPGRTMPSFGDKLTQAEIASVLEYIKAGWMPEQLRLQSEVSRN